MKIDVTFPGGLAIDAAVSGFTLHTDQPKSYGGGGTALSPFEIFLSSIATCSGYYALAFCRERDIPTEGMSLTANFERHPETKALSKVVIDLKLPDNFPEKYQKPIIRTIDQCSVKKSIMAQPSFEINVS